MWSMGYASQKNYILNLKCKLGLNLDRALGAVHDHILDSCETDPSIEIDDCFESESKLE